MKKEIAQCFDCYSDAMFRYHGQTGAFSELQVQLDYVAGLTKPVTVVKCSSCTRELEYIENNGKWDTKIKGGQGNVI